MADRRVRSLMQALRARVVLLHAGRFALTLGALQLVPLLVSVLAGELALTPWCAAASGVALVLGGLLSRLHAPSDLQRNEALAAPALLFFAAPFVLMLPSVGAGMTPLDAFFEAVSGITTTGLSVVGDVEALPRTILFARAWAQWVGGLGVVVFALLLFLGPGTAARRLVGEDLDQNDLIGNTRVHARRVLTFYVAFTLVGFVAAWIGGAGAFDSLVHTMSAISTGGFSSRTESLAAFDGTFAPAVLSVVSILGAISFGLYSRMRSSGARTLFADVELRALFAAMVATTAALAECQWWTAGAPPVSGSDLLITAVSAQTTTGFSNLPIADLSPASKAVLIVSMTIGGDFGSTAGGVKIGRALILLRVIQLLVLRRSMSSHAVVDVRSGGRRVQPADVEAALALVLLYLVAIFGSWLAFLVAGYDPLDSMFEVTSAMGTVGLSAGITGADLAPFLKGVLCVDMWLGRLEILPALVLLQPRGWIVDGGTSR